MSQTIFITGGAGSGKSDFAEKMASGFGERLCYLATAQTLDSEMAERVSRHRERRGVQWRTIEEPINLTQTLESCEGTCEVILVDCITLWLSNLIFKYEKFGGNVEHLICEEVERLVKSLRGMQTPVIMVSNEVGMGIVPENRLARLFRDIAGKTNQALAAAADEVYLVVSGIPLKLKFTSQNPYPETGGG